MMELNCRWTFALLGEIDEQQKDQLLSIMDCLIDLEELDADLTDSAVGLNLENQTIEISVVARAGMYEDCVAKAMSAIRNAIDNSGLEHGNVLASDESQLNSVVFEPLQLTSIA